MAGSIIVIASSKGGVGKTIITTTLAVNLAAFGFAVSVVDADRNQAFATWFQIAEAPALSCSTCIDHNEIVGHVMAEAEKHDVVLVDTAGFENQTAVFAMGAADLVVIPVMPDRNSMLEARKTARQVQSVSKIARRDIPYRILCTRWNPKNLAERATIEDIEGSGLPRLQQHLADLSAFQKLTFSGVVPRSGVIGAQVDRIITELQDLGAIAAKPVVREVEGAS